MTNIYLRLANKTDLQILAEVYALSYNSADIGEHWTAVSAMKLIEYLHTDQPDLFYVAIVDEQTVGGIVATVKPWEDGNHLVDGELFLHPNYQKLGIGTKLIQKLFTTAKEKYQVVAWDTFTHIIHKHPLDWYKNIGFEEVKQWTMITGNVDKVLTTINTMKK